MHTELNDRYLGLFLAPKETDRPPYQAMPTGQTPAAHDFLLLMQLPDFTTTGADEVAAIACPHA